MTRAVFYGLGADGTVGATKNTVKIIGENTPLHAQGYFVYDSKKSGAITVSHLRFGPEPIDSTYLIGKADFVACHQFEFMEKLDVLELARPGATFLLNSPYGPDEVWGKLPREAQQTIVDRKLRFFVVDALAVAKTAGLAGRINTVTQACFFAISGILPRDEAIDKIKDAIRKTYGKRGETVLARNFAAVDGSLAAMAEVKVPDRADSLWTRRPIVPKAAPDFVQRVTAMMLDGKGDLLPVSAMPVDGTFPTGTTQWEKRSIAQEIPIWDETICTQCAICPLVCPHAAIRMKVFSPDEMKRAPSTFKAVPWTRKDSLEGMLYSLQVAPDDCTGCGVCVDVCPTRSKQVVKHKAINMAPKLEHLEAERANYEFFLSLPEVRPSFDTIDGLRGSQLRQPLFEYSGACSGCGETPYLKLLSQLYGDHLVIANATGCSSIYGGNLPTTPYSKNADGQGPTWANSLFEDNAEFGLGMRLALDAQQGLAQMLVRSCATGSARNWPTRCSTRRRTTTSRSGAARARQAAEGDAAEARHARSGPPARGGRQPRDPQRLDRRRRRLGLRHRLRRPRPRARLRPQRQHPGARHRGLQQHRRPGVEVDAARRGGEVRRGRQVDRQEGPRHDRDGVRQRLRRAGRDGREPGADGAHVPGGGGVERAVADHRLQPLHRARHRHDDRR